MMEAGKVSRSFQTGITTILLMVALLMFTEASLYSSKRIQFQQMQNQILRDHQSSLLNGAIIDMSACAYLCIKEETCLTFSYNEKTQECLLSSAFPEVAADDAAILSLVFMRVEDRLLQGQDSYFERHNLVLPVVATVKRVGDRISIQSCAEACVEDCTCFGFTYYPLTAECELLMREPADCEEAETGMAERLQYLIHRVEQNIAEGQNIAKDKPATQSSTWQQNTADLAVNGVDNDRSSTTYETQPYWRVDLEESYLVASVKIHLPTSKVINDPTVYVGITGEITYLSENMGSRNYLDHPICGSVDGTMSSDYLFTCTQPLLGRYVFVDCYSDIYGNHLTLAEVEVFYHCNSNN